MQKCIYCPTVFDEAQKEHIIHAFLGARWKDGRLICDACQSLFASRIDAALARRIQPFRLLLGTEGNYGGTGERITNLPATSGETVHIGPHGQPSLARPIVTVNEDGDRHQVQLKIDGRKQLGWALNEVKKLLPHAQLDQSKIAGLGVPTRERIDGEITFDLTLGGLDFFRGVLKCCSNLFAAHDREARAAFLGSEFDAVRGFVANGTGDMGDFARWLVDSEPLNLPSRGPADQTIVLTTRDGSVEGVMRFFGHLPFAVRLATNYVGPPVRCAYIVDPYREADPAEERLSGMPLAQYDSQIPIFLQQSPGNSPVVQNAWNANLNRFMSHYIERENEATAQKVVDETIRQNPAAASMPRNQLLEMVRRLIRAKFDRFEQTGDASGITVFKTPSDMSADPQ